MQNGERSLSVPFSRRDIASSTATGGDTKKDATNPPGDCVDADEVIFFFFPSSTHDGCREELCRSC